MFLASMGIVRRYHPFFTKPDYGDSMNKTELVEIVAKEADLSKAADASALDAVIAAIVTVETKGDNDTLI